MGGGHVHFTRCVCVDILRWEHASFHQLAQYSTQRVEKPAPSPSNDKKKETEKEKCLKECQLYSTLTSLLIYTQSKHLANCIYSSATLWERLKKNRLADFWTGTYKSSSLIVQSAKSPLFCCCSVLVCIEKRKRDNWNAVSNTVDLFQLSGSSR